MLNSSKYNLLVKTLVIFHRRTDGQTDGQDQKHYLSPLTREVKIVLPGSFNIFARVHGKQPCQQTTMSNAWNIMSMGLVSWLEHLCDKRVYIWELSSFIWLALWHCLCFHAIGVWMSTFTLHDNILFVFVAETTLLVYAISLSYSLSCLVLDHLYIPIIATYGYTTGGRYQ